jgi:L-ascorbate metabolism protein UlaG (beta-lactamase superfamily)
MAMPVAGRWMGTAHIELSLDGGIVLIDPYVTRASKFSIFLRPLEADRASVESYTDSLDGVVRAVLVGHTHFDHALDIPALAGRTQAAILGSASLDALLDISGLPGRVTVCRPQERTPAGDGITVTMIPSLHGLVLSRLLLLEGEIDRAWKPPLRANRYRLGAMHSVKVEMGGITFLHIGSAGFLEGELAGHTCDVLFLCAAGWKSRPGYPERIVGIVRPSCIVPIHYDDFSLPLTPGRDFRMIRSADIHGLTGRLKRIRPNLEIRLPAPGERLSF